MLTELQTITNRIKHTKRRPVKKTIINMPIKFIYGCKPECPRCGLEKLIMLLTPKRIKTAPYPGSAIDNSMGCNYCDFTGSELEVTNHMFQKH